MLFIFQISSHQKYYGNSAEEKWCRQNTEFFRVISFRLQYMQLQEPIATQISTNLQMSYFTITTCVSFSQI